MLENNKVLVVVNEDVDFALVAANIAKLQVNHTLDICFVDVLKPSRKNKWLKRTSEKQITEARRLAREQKIDDLLSFHGLNNDNSSSIVLSGDLVQEVVRMAVKDSFDLVLKAADHSATKTSGRDLNLLRKCPKPFLLLKPFARPIENIVASVDIEEDDEKLDHDLNRRIIDSALKVASSMGQRLEVMSSWQLENESDLRDNPFFKISEQELDQALLDCQHQASNDLVKLVEEYHDNAYNVTLSMGLIKGEPTATIPKFTADNKVDLLVMGTVARAGLRGLVVGNTAEEILPALECSILAVKPLGFKSPY